MTMLNRRDCFARCNRCGLDFPIGVSVPCDLTVYVAALKVLRCPTCGKRGKNLSVYSPGRTPAEAAAAASWDIAL